MPKLSDYLQREVAATATVSLPTEKTATSVVQPAVAAVASDETQAAKDNAVAAGVARLQRVYSNRCGHTLEHVCAW